MASLLLACGEIKESCRSVETATITLYARIDERDFEAIHRLMTQDLQREYPLARLEEVFGAINDKAGTCDTPKLAGCSVHFGSSDAGAADVVSVALCDRAQLVGTLKWQLMGEQAKLTSFGFQDLIAGSGR